MGEKDIEKVVLLDVRMHGGEQSKFEVRRIIIVIRNAQRVDFVFCDWWITSFFKLWREFPLLSGYEGIHGSLEGYFSGQTFKEKGRLCLTAVCIK